MDLRNSIISQLDPLPEITICPPSHKCQITKHKWYISESKMSSKIKNIIKNIETIKLQSYEDQNNSHSSAYKSAIQDKITTIQLCNNLRLLAQLNKHYADPFLQLYVAVNLGTIYDILQLQRLSINSNQKVLRKIQAQSIKYHKLEAPPLQITRQNISYFSNFNQRYWLHYLQAKIQFKLGVSDSSKFLHKQAFCHLQKSYLLTIKAMLQLMIVYLHQILMIFSRVRNNGALLENNRSRIINWQAEVGNYKFCLSLLYHTGYINSRQIKGDPQLQKLLQLVHILINTINQTQLLNFPQYNQQNKQFIPNRLKNKRFLQFSQLDYVTYADIAQKSIQENPQSIFELIAFWVCEIYAYSIQIQFIQKQESSKKQPISFSEHWLAKSLENAYKYLAGTTLFTQIKALYQRNYGKKNKEIQQIPQNQEQFDQYNKDSNKFNFTDKVSLSRSRSHQKPDNSPQNNSGIKIPIKISRKKNQPQISNSEDNIKVIVIKQNEDKIMFVKRYKKFPINYHNKYSTKSHHLEIDDPKGMLLKYKKFTDKPNRNIEPIPRKLNSLKKNKPSNDKNKIMKNRIMNRSVETAKNVYGGRLIDPINYKPRTRQENLYKIRQSFDQRVHQIDHYNHGNYKNDKYTKNMVFHYNTLNLDIYREHKDIQIESDDKKIHKKNNAHNNSFRKNQIINTIDLQRYENLKYYD